ncbi:MAG: DUF1697 domain-containing protein [Flavobacteriia bacterium]|nr:DUF1697 domain-containing protein [Flavobacteriia bacterium]
MNIHLLRGINVGGHKKIPMVQLRECYERLGLKDVRTYIQSGNVVFEGDIENEVLERSIQEVTGFEVPGMLFDASEWVDIVKHAPTIYDSSGKEIKKYITLTQKQASGSELTQVVEKLSNEEVLTFHGRALYLHYPSDLKKPFFTNTTVEKILGQYCTTRNWNTVVALKKMVS